MLVDDKVVSSCIMLTAQASGRAVTTSEGLCGADGQLREAQRGEAIAAHAVALLTSL